MLGSTAFAQRGNTRRMTAFPTLATSAVRMSVIADMPQADNYIITNFGPSVAFVGLGSSVTEAIDNAKVPTSGDPTGNFCFVVPPGQRSIEAKHGVYFTAVTEAGKADLLITPGKGSIESDTDIASSEASTANLAALVLYESGAQQELMRAILVELRTQTEFLKEGLNVAEDPDSIRGDQKESIN